MNNERKSSILVVNGEPEIADLFAEMLFMDLDPYIVTTTFTGKGCLSGIKKNRPDMVLMDIELPDIDGWELIDKIKKNDPDLPVVVITSRIPGINDMMRLSQVSDYLVKPVTLDCLQMAVKDALEIPRLLDQCLEAVGHREIERVMYLTYLLVKQNIADRKRFILMRQLYSDRKLDTDPESKKYLSDLKERINSAQTKITQFKSSRFLLA